MRLNQLEAALKALIHGVSWVKRGTAHAIHNADVPSSSPGVATIIFKGLAKASPFSFWAAITKRQQPGPPSHAPQVPPHPAVHLGDALAQRRCLILALLRSPPLPEGEGAVGAVGNSRVILNTQCHLDGRRGRQVQSRTKSAPTPMLP